MNNEEKILEILSQMQEDQKQMRDDLAGVKDRLGFVEAVQVKMEAAQGQIQEDLSDLRTTVTRVALTQENIVLKSLDALVEGQELTHQRLKDLAGKDELAELREEVRLLRSVVAQHSREIEALKAAQ